MTKCQYDKLLKGDFMVVAAKLKALAAYGMQGIPFLIKQGYFYLKTAFPDNGFHFLDRDGFGRLSALKKLDGDYILIMRKIFIIGKDGNVDSISHCTNQKINM